MNRNLEGLMGSLINIIEDDRKGINQYVQKN